MAWTIETIDDGNEVGWSCAMVLGNDCCPHIAYSANSNGDLWYAYGDSSGSWHTEVVETTGIVGGYCAIALDSNDNPHISYRRADSPNRALKYAYKTSGSWITEIVESADIYDNSIVVDADGYPHISYYRGDYPYYQLKYAHKDEGGWHIDIIDLDPIPPYLPGVGEGNSIALDSNGYPHISYHDEENAGLKYAYQDIGGWNVETIRAGKSRANTSLILDSNDNAHIACYWDDDLTYTYKDSGSWNHENTGEPDGNVGGGVSLGLDSNSYPHISYQYRGWPLWEHLKRAYKNGDGWHIEDVDDTDDVGYAHSLTVDARDCIRICYQANYANADLNYAHQDCTCGWVRRTYFLLA